MFDAFGYRVPACSYSGTASAPRAAGGGCATSWARQARAQTDVAGQLYLSWLRQGSARVQDLTSPIAPKAPTANFRIRSGAPHRTRKRVDHPSACVCLLRIHPAQPRRWETVRYAPLACTKRRYRLVPSLVTLMQRLQAWAWRRGISRSCHLVPLATSW